MMTYTGSIREGIRLIHSRWQLIAAQIVLSIVGCIGFTILVGIPLVAVVVTMGFDISEISRLREFLLGADDPLDLIRRYLGIGLLILFAVLLYALVVFCLWVYVLGASAGVITDSLREPLGRFTLRRFMQEGRRLFLPLIGYTSVVGAAFVGAVFVLGIFGGAAAAFTAAMKLKGAIFGVTMGVFAALVIILMGIASTFGAIVATFFGTAVMAVEGSGPVETAKKTMRYLRDMPSSMGLFLVVLAGYIVIYGVGLLIGIGLDIAPFGGAVLFVPYQILLYLLQGYLNIVMLAIAIIYYFHTAPIVSGPTCGDSIPASDTSPEEAPAQAPPQEVQPRTGEAQP
ncbi:MAG: hypothetical protein Q8J64_04895 [Thermodesulfovibrionales bacterium]|nr:hypothetical protein [Thermodesulfovibrionales bacterium]